MEIYNAADESLHYTLPSKLATSGSTFIFNKKNRDSVDNWGITAVHLSIISKTGNLEEGKGFKITLTLIDNISKLRKLFNNETEANSEDKFGVIVKLDNKTL